MFQQEQPHDALQTYTAEGNNDDEPEECTEMSNVILVHEQSCTYRKWQDHKYPCHHAMAYFCNWTNLSFPKILTTHVH